MTKRQRVRLVKLLLSITVLLIAGYLAHKLPATEQIATQAGAYKIAEFDDGDTIVVNMNGSLERVRFIGVDTPETKDPRKAVQCYGHEASDFTKDQLNNGLVRLESDPTDTNRDRYGRLLRYVYTTDGTLLNAELIKQGYGFAYTGFPFEKKQEFVQYQDEAMAAHIGLWAACQPTVNQYGGYTSNDL